jgi:hypothetical protein
MRFIVEHPDGRREEAHLVGENFTLGLGGTLHRCICGTQEFVDASTDEPPDEREPDRECPCGRKFWYYDDESDHAGHLHSDDELNSSDVEVRREV